MSFEKSLFIKLILGFQYVHTLWLSDPTPKETSVEADFFAERKGHPVSFPVVLYYISTTDKAVASSQAKMTAACLRSIYLHVKRAAVLSEALQAFCGVEGLSILGHVYQLDLCGYSII